MSPASSRRSVGRPSSRVPTPYPTAHLEIDVEQLRSGNSLYDAELLRRIDARRHPTVTLDLRGCTALGSTGRYQLQGEVTFHGVSRPLDGTVSVAMPCEHTLVVRGEQVVDIRDFGVVSPTVLMLRIYPDVVVGLQVEAELEEQPNRRRLMSRQRTSYERKRTRWDWCWSSQPAM